MSDWALVAIIGIIATYKLIDRWLDGREYEEKRESDTYSTTETAPHEIRDNGERYIPEVVLGFQRELP